MSTFIKLLLIGFAMVVIGIVALVKDRKNKNRRTASTSAIISQVDEAIDAREDGANKGRRYYYTPTFSYQVNGRYYTCGGVYSYSKGHYRVGDTAKVWFDPLNPENASTQEATKAKSSFGIVVLLMGIALCVLAFTQ